MHRARLLTAAVSGALLAGLLAAAPPGATADEPPVPVPVLAPRDDTVCPALFGYSDDTLRPNVAQAIMAGNVDMGEYGTMTIPVRTPPPPAPGPEPTATPDPTGTPVPTPSPVPTASPVPPVPLLAPTWLPQASLDLAGNRYQSGLRWTLPLLRVGMDPGGNPVTRAAFTAQFVALLRDWVQNHPPSSRDLWINHPQYGGFRLGAFVCAVRELPDPVDNAWMAGQARVELAVQLRQFFVAGANNTMLNSALAAYAAAMQPGVGTVAQQNTARSNVLRLVTALTNADGSDKEGAPGYGVYLDTIMARVATVFDVYGQRAAAATVRAAIARSADFAAAASRPDRRLETIGDTDLQWIPKTLYPADSAATWVATSGAAGRPPRSRYTSWSGGYVFGRSAWVAGTDEQSTFYSVRTASTTPSSAHRHSDSTAVTYYSQGVPWVSDPGPYRYDTSGLRNYLRGRSAHSALVSAGTPAFIAPARWVTTGSAGGVDSTCVRDPAYEPSARVDLVRCVYFVRALDALVVQDFARPTARSTRVTQQFMLPPEVTSARVDAGAVTLTGRTPSGQDRLATLTTSRRPTATAATFGQTYGQSSAGRRVAVSWLAPVGLTSSTTTVLVPGMTGALADATRIGGRAALRISVGGRSVSFPTAYTRLPIPRVSSTLAMSKATLRRGAKVVLTGRLSAAGRALAGAVVTVQRYRPATRRWVTAGTTRTTAWGWYSLALRPTATGRRSYRVSVAGKPGASGWKAGESRTVRLTVVKPKPKPPVKTRSTVSVHKTRR